MSEVEITRKYKDDKDIFYKKIEVKPVPEAAVSFDTDSTLLKTIAEAGTTDQLDTSTIESFTNLTQRRDKIYDSLDLMYNDSLVSAIVRSYCEDATETNEKGQIVWAESDDADTNSYINFLLKSLQVDKNVYSWVECLAKYGDVYLKLYRESDKKKFEDLFKEDVEEEVRTPLNEDLIVHAYAKGDKLIDYLEMEKNPAELFELTKFGKTMGYIKADSKVTSSYKSELGFPNYKYKFKKGDIHIYDATKYAHASLDDLSGRIPEEVELFTTDDEWENDSTDYSFGVRRGQSLFYDAYKAWRELTLMENSMLLNRITKSSVTRVVQVEVGNMAPEEVPVKLMNVKSLMEQKTAINPGTSMDEYTMPGALENTVYVATYNGQGTITTSQVGGDIDVKGISDIDFFRQKFFGSMSVPSAYFGYTDDAAGFSGGQSLAIISSRYGKAVKHLQSCIRTLVTDIINMVLLDRKQDKFINKFRIMMKTPVTQEELDARDNISARMQIVNDIMNSIADIDDMTTKLTILKSLLANTITDQDVINEIQKYIDKLESGEVTDDTSAEGDMGGDFGGGFSGGGADFGGNDDMNFDLGGPEDETNGGTDMGIEPGSEPTTDVGETDNAGGAPDLPSGADLGIDLTA